MGTPDGARGDSALAGLLSAVTTALLVAVLALAGALVVVPRALDGAALTVLTGSMVPTYEPGDVVVVRGVQDAAAEVQVGDVVTFQPVSDDPTLVTHRVVDKQFTGDGVRFVTRGDANGADDDPLVPEQIKGVALYHVPAVGHVSLWLGGHRGTVVVAVAAALLVYAVLMLLRPDRATATSDDRTPAPDPTDDRPDHRPDHGPDHRPDEALTARVPSPGGAP
ncbi:signal peptidase I [Cellulomonas shaoxiangyii]|uniref:Signal peptidase I n=1 Tax=Cellulomonas shaoxiangyii TaxID=2566013 RepID=A0A4P7SK61_9CELL|nr:signal peptidase I [Cellulomonas shaoxiangyii]QCB93857.1 signal peptidase I [Cellulomonas shaoxiangyii]TGY84584.1 signal peptidase I [Cellulomonas shaoxiangyii]